MKKHTKMVSQAPRALREHELQRIKGGDGPVTGGPGLDMNQIQAQQDASFQQQLQLMQLQQ